MKSMRSKKVWLTAFLATAFTLFGAGVATVDTTTASAENTITAESVGLVMDKGAGVRLGAADGNNGIRFVLTMDKTEYSSLMETVGTDEEDLYSEISFGMLITKASYVTDAKELTVENVFGNNAVFEWKPEGADENWKVSEGKTLVVNQTFGYLGAAEDYENDYVGFASLVSLHEYNLTQEFVGRGYMKYTAKDGTVSYRMANYYEDARANNVRSMVYVAQKAAEDPAMSAYKDTLNNLYINHSTVQAETVDVTIKHHKVDVHGEETIETETLSGQTIGTTVTATAWESDEWIYNASKSTASGVVYANDKTALDLYYDQNPETVYDWYQVGKTSAATNTLTLDEVVTGGIYNDEVELELSLDLLSGTMPRLKFYFLTAGDAQITDPAINGWINVADYYDETTGTYKFKTYFKWNSASWDIGKVFLQLEDGEYQLGVDVLSVNLLSDYDVIINKTQAVTYNLPEPVEGAVYGDTAEITLRLTERVTDLTKLHLTLLNKKGETIAHNNNTYYTLADCVTEEENVYKFAMTFPWKGGDWDITAIKFTVDAKTYVVGVNVESIEIIPVKYDVKFTANAAHEQQTYTLASPIKATKGDKIEIVFTMTNFYGTTNGASTDIYFYLNDALGNVAVTPGWLELSDLLVEGTTNQYKVVANVNASVEIYSIKTQVKYAQMSGLNFETITVIAKDYDFVIDKANDYTYTLPETVTGAVRYDTMAVTVEITELVGDLTKLHVQLVNTTGTVVANNSNKYFTLADCVTGEENVYTFALTFPWANGNWDISQIIFTVGDTEHVVGFNVKSAEIEEVAYQLEYSVASGSQKKVYTFDKVAGGKQNGYVKLTFDVAVFVGALTNIQFNLCTDTAGATTVANSNKAWNEDGTKITSSGGQISMNSLTGKKTVTIVTTFPWANGNWDLQSIQLQLYGSNLKAGVSNIQVELMPNFVPVA